MSVGFLEEVNQVSFLEDYELRASRVRKQLPIIPWSMLRIHNEHSMAFRGRYSPETSPWGVEICECQYWPHVRTVDIVGPPQAGKTYHGCELPTLYDLIEARETVFYMNASAKNAENLWKTRWVKTLRADPVLREQLLDRMDGGQWDERHFADGGLLYSAGPESAAALSQREARVVRCSELEKTRESLRDEASSYALAKDRAAAYPGTSMVTSDCTITTRKGLSWIRFRAGDRSRPFIPCAKCGHYAMPAHERHVAEADLALTLDDVHLLEIPALVSPSTPTTAEESARLVCKKCGSFFSNRTLREAGRAVVWVPSGCNIVRHDNPEKTPVPRVRWLDDLRAWAGLQMADPDVVEGEKPPDDPPKWSGPRLPDDIELAWSPTLQTSVKSELPAFQLDPRKNPARSFWFWRSYSPKYTIGQIAREITEGELGELTGDPVDDHKTVMQKCFVLPYVEQTIGDADDISEDAVRACASALSRGSLPEHTIAISAAVDVNEDFLRAIKRAWTSDGKTYLIDHTVVSTGKLTAKDQGRDFQATRTQSIYRALDRVWEWLQEKDDATPGLTYVDSRFMSDEINAWCGRKHFARVRPCKGFASEGVGKRRRDGDLPGRWTDACEKRALECQNVKGKPLKHQYYDDADPRRMMKLHVDHWKKEVHNGVRVMSVYRKAEKLKAQDSAAKPWFFLHADFERRDECEYCKQLAAERWEEFENPKTGRREWGWREYFRHNHFLDVEGYAFAAAAALGIDVGRMSGQFLKSARKRKYGVLGKSF